MAPAPAITVVQVTLKTFANGFTPQSAYSHDHSNCPDTSKTYCDQEVLGRSHPHRQRQGFIYTQCNAYANVYHQGQRQRTRFKMSNQLCRFFICDLHTSQIHAVHPFDKCSPPYWRLSFFCTQASVHVDLQKERFWTLWRRSLFDIRRYSQKNMKISNGFALKGGGGLVSVLYI